MNKVPLTIAGAETTTKMIGNTAILLQQHPDQRALLLERPELLPNAIEEALRYNSTTHIMTRTLTTEMTDAAGKKVTSIAVYDRQ